MLADRGRAFWACFLDESGDFGVVGDRSRRKNSWGKWHIGWAVCVDDLDNRDDLRLEVIFHGWVAGEAGDPKGF
jgi:hypothetical protein